MAAPPPTASQQAQLDDLLAFASALPPASTPADPEPPNPFGPVDSDPSSAQAASPATVTADDQMKGAAQSAGASFAWGDGGAETPSSSATAVQKRRSLLWGDPNKGQGGKESSQAFAERLASAKASVVDGSNNMKAAAATKYNLRQKKYKGGRELLRQLQTAAGVNDDTVLSSLTVGSAKVPASDEGAEASTVAPKKGFGYKLNAFARRAEQRVMNAISKGDKASDDSAFGALWSSVQQQEKTLRELHVDTKELMKAMDSMTKASAKLASGFASLCCERPPPGKSLSEEEEHTAARANRLKDICDAILNEVRTEATSQLDANVLKSVDERVAELPSYSAIVDKRNSYMLDREGFQRKLDALREKGPGKDPAAWNKEVEIKQEQLAAAEKRFAGFDEALKAEFDAVDAHRFEHARQLVEGAVEAQAFMLSRSLELMRMFNEAA